MSTEHLLDTKGKVTAKPTQDAAAPQKDNANRPLTSSQIQGKLNPSTVAQMQRTVGNATVQRFLAQRSGQGPSAVDEETSATINNRRGSGQTLDDGIANKAGAVMGQDFSGVNVHTDHTADNLSRNLGAVAFTTGNDIFFRSGAYNPKSSEGQKLISHELTHVVQQGASTPSVQSKMTVNDPNDQYEKEADHVADQVMSKPEDFGVQQQEEEEAAPVEAQEEDMAMGKWLQRQEMPEDELATKRVQREAAPEDEMQTKRVQRQEMPEDEMAMGKQVQREAIEEEEAAPVEAQEEEMAMGKWVQREALEEEESVPAESQEEEMAMGKWVQREEASEDESIGRKADIQRHDDHEQI